MLYILWGYLVVEYLRSLWTEISWSFPNVIFGLRKGLYVLCQAWELRGELFICVGGLLREIWKVFIEVEVGFVENVFLDLGVFELQVEFDTFAFVAVDFVLAVVEGVVVKILKADFLFFFQFFCSVCFVFFYLFFFVLSIRIGFFTFRTFYFFFNNFEKLKLKFYVFILTFF